MQEILIYDGEDMELRRLAHRVDARKNEAARQTAEQRAQRAEEKLREERARMRKEHARMRKEKRELAAFVTVIALFVVMLVCGVAGPIWTAAFPMAGALAVLRKVGWM